MTTFTYDTGISGLKPVDPGPGCRTNMIYDTSGRMPLVVKDVLSPGYVPNMTYDASGLKPPTYQSAARETEDEPIVVTVPPAE